MKIVADDKIPFLRGALEPFAEVVYMPGREITSDTIAGAEALLVRTRTKCNEQLLRGSTVKFIATATIGFDHIDTGYCEANNIFWTNAPGCNSSSVQQYIASALLCMATERNILLKEKTLGIIGVGNVGSKVARLAKAFGMKILLNDPPRARREGAGEFVNLETILREADIITLHVPLTLSGPDKTFHLFDDTAFSMMKMGSWFFNSSRGEVVETAALRKSLDASHTGGAVIDVWENEPDIDLALLSKAFIATPHIAGYSTDGKANGTSIVVNSLAAFFNLPLNNWYPDNVPQPPFPQIEIDGTGRSYQSIIYEAVLHTYRIMEDDSRLRNTPSAFEKQRGEYPLRREFPSYSVRLSNSGENIRSVLRNIGFIVI
jgi:erythronate-4-phosphate dehydrogenase